MNGRRIQRRRTKGWRMPEGAVYVGRPSRWGNPYRYASRAESAAAFSSSFLAQHPEVAEAARAELRGKDLVCWCPLDQPCHADVLLRIANERGDVHREERNPNTTDDEIIPIGWNERGEPAFMRRPVSSEDVHREAAE